MLNGQLPRRGHRLRHARLEVHRGGEGRQDDDGRAARGRGLRCRARAGHCMTMGTASTMASMVEALGMALPGNAAIPAVDCAPQGAWRTSTGRRIVEMVKEDLRHVEDPDPQGLRERDLRQRRDRRLDQRRRPPAGASPGASASTLTLDDWDRLRPRRAVPRQPDAVGQVPDGGLLLRRRPAGGDPRDSAGVPAQEGADRQRPRRSGTTSRTRSTTTRR